MGVTSSSLETQRVVGITAGIMTAVFAVVAASVWKSGVHKRIMIMFSVPTAIAIMCHYILQLEDVSAFLRIDDISFEQTFWVLAMFWAFFDGICLALQLYMSKIIGAFVAVAGVAAAFLFLVAGRASDADVRWSFFSFGVFTTAFTLITSVLGARSYWKINIGEDGQPVDAPLEYKRFELLWVIISHVIFAAIFFSVILTFALAPEGKHHISGPRRDIANFVVSLGMIASHVGKIIEFRDHTVKSE